MKNYLKQYLSEPVVKTEIFIERASAKTDKTYFQKGIGTFGTNLSYEYQENNSEETCHHCGANLRVQEFSTRTEIECTNNPLHYSEIKRKPGADRLWDDVALPHELKRQRPYDLKRTRNLHYALEMKTVLGIPKWGFCEVGCGHWIQFYFFDGVGFGYCKKCRVDQTIDNR